MVVSAFRKNRDVPARHPRVNRMPCFSTNGIRHPPFGSTISRIQIESNASFGMSSVHSDSMSMVFSPFPATPNPVPIYGHSDIRSFRRADVLVMHKLQDRGRRPRILTGRSSENPRDQLPLRQQAVPHYQSMPRIVLLLRMGQNLFLHFIPNGLLKQTTRFFEKQFLQRALSC
jgi:hypothetical protein